MSYLGLVAESERMPPGGGNIEGAPALAGHFNLPSLLVREAVQNSWDARDDERGQSPVRFEIHGWDLNADEADALRRVLPVGGLDGFARGSLTVEKTGSLHPRAVLEQDALQILVIADRNTVGLCGPTRSGVEWDPVRHGRELVRGQQRFANFIRNSGRPTSEIGRGDGGAFGIGKAALWMASMCGTLLVHTRTTDEEGNACERFIGSVHGDHFYANRLQYTGRHLIGVPGEDGVIEPLVGADAALAVRGLPIPAYRYGGEPTDGTTIVIVAPRLALGWKTEIERVRDAVRWQVWPKLVPAARPGADGPDMEIEIGWNNNPVDVPAPLSDPEVRPYAMALLDCLRERNSSEENRDHIARCRSPLKDLGQVKFRNGGTRDQNVFHLTLGSEELTQVASQVVDGPRDSIDTDPAVDFETPWGQIALIRREPLLLVRYERIGGPDAAAGEIGVFLSADDPEVEEALTKSEPPAHDDWIYKNVPRDSSRDHRRTFAKRTIDEIRAARSRFLGNYRGADSGASGGGEQAVSRQISEHLMGGLGGGLAPKPPGKGGGATRIGPQAELRLIASDHEGPRTVHEVDVALSGLGSVPTAVALIASVAALDNMGSMGVGDLVEVQWADSNGRVTVGSSLNASAIDGDQFSLFITVTGHLRIRPQVKVGLPDVD